MARIKGPGIFLAQFLRDEAPWDNLKNVGGWVKDLGYVGVQIPSWDARVMGRHRRGPQPEDARPGLMR